MPGKTDKKIIASCGEYYVAAYLSGFDLIVALPRAGVPTCDMLVTSDLKGPAIKIQVKTGTQSKTTTKKKGDTWYEWPINEKVIEKEDEFLWLNDWPKKKENCPELFFVPSKAVASEVRKRLQEGKKWLFYCIEGDDIQNYMGRNGLESILETLGIES
jgi:hypothetical protein